MPDITVEFLSGREFVAAVTDAAVNILKANRASVRILLYEIEKFEVADGGVFESDKSQIQLAHSPF